MAYTQNFAQFSIESDSWRFTISILRRRNEVSHHKIEAGIEEAMTMDGPKLWNELPNGVKKLLQEIIYFLPIPVTL